MGRCHFRLWWYFFFKEYIAFYGLVFFSWTTSNAVEIKITADKIRILRLPAFRSRTTEQDFHTLVWDREYKREIPNEVAQIFPGAYIAYSLCNPNQSPFCCKHFLAPANIAAEHSLFQINKLVFRMELWILFVLFVVFKFEENLKWDILHGCAPNLRITKCFEFSV